MPSVEDPPPNPYSTEEMQRLLDHAWATEDQFHCTAFVALGAFVGPRTQERLRARCGTGGVDIGAGLVTVPAKAAKKRQARILEMPVNLQQILIALRERPRVRNKHWRELPRPTDEGAKIVSPKLLAHFKKSLKTIGFTWKHNGLRSSFASHEYERSGDLARTMSKLGHVGSPEVFFNHYHGIVAPAGGKKYFGLLPRANDWAWPIKENGAH
jgi:hypothetical protein